MELKTINEKQLDDFLKDYPDAHFMQTSGFIEVSKKRNYIPHLLGLFNNNKINASALLLEKKIGPFSTFYCPCGFILDYSNHQLIKNMINELKKYVLNNKGLYLKINPDLIIRKLDENANPVYTIKENYDLIDFIKSCGGKHRGFTINFSESSAPRFTFRVDVSLTKEEIFNKFHNTTKKILKENNPYQIEISKNDKDALNDFYKVMKETSIRKKLYVESFDYFKDFYESLNKHNQADIFVASVNINNLKNIFKNKLDNVDLEINNLKNKTNNIKNENKINDLNLKRNKILKLKNQIDLIKEDRIVLSSIITAKSNNKVWTIHGGNSDQLMFLNANYELYYHILLDSKENGYKYVDFYGSQGKVDKESPLYGIYLFKLRFGGEFIEFIGEFDFVMRPLLNSIINTLLKIRRKILYRRSLK